MPTNRGSADGAQVLAQRIPIHAGNQLFNIFVGALPDGQGTGEEAPSFFSENQDAAAAVGGVVVDFDEAAALKRLQRGGQGGSIHGQQRSDRSHRWRLGTIERHEQGELSVG